MKDRRTLVMIARAAVYALIALTSSTAVAGSIAQAPPHDPARARAAIERFVALIDRNDYRAYLYAPGLVLVFTDEHGHVLGEVETRSFLAAMNVIEGNEDRAPIRVEQVRPLVRDRYNPVYVVRIERQRWFPRAEEELNGLVPERPAGYSPSWETWLASFHSNQLFSFREVRELHSLGRGRD